MIFVTNGKLYGMNGENWGERRRLWVSTGLTVLNSPYGSIVYLIFKYKDHVAQIPQCLYQDRSETQAHSFINIAGLAIGLASGLPITVFV